MDNLHRLKVLEEFKIDASKGDVKLTDWAEKFGYLKTSGLVYFLNKHNVKYHTKNTPRIFSEDEKQNICELYKNGRTLKEIMELYDAKSNIPFSKIISDNNITIRNLSDYSNEVKLSGVQKFGPERLSKSFNNAVKILKERNFDFKVIKNSNRATMIELVCEKCGEVTKYDPHSILERFKNKQFKECVCNVCLIKTTYPDIVSALPIKKSNTTGYIGVGFSGVKYREGFKVSLEYNKVRLIVKLYKDPSYSDKTLIEAAVYREKYIIENDLPHTRNFSDEELISNMEMLGEYSQIEGIKKLLEERKENG